jgi:hypothetical protein
MVYCSRQDGKVQGSRPETRGVINKVGVLVQAVKVEEATGLLAARYAPERYHECRLE